jgi:hypothetical protein
VSVASTNQRSITRRLQLPQLKIEFSSTPTDFRGKPENSTDIFSPTNRIFDTKLFRDLSIFDDFSSACEECCCA